MISTWKITYTDWDGSVKVGHVDVEDGSDLDKQLNHLQFKEKDINLLKRPEKLTDAFSSDLATHVAPYPNKLTSEA